MNAIEMIAQCLRHQQGDPGPEALEAIRSRANEIADQGTYLSPPPAVTRERLE